ncbi:class C sortase [Chakrabartyella piscis]|uniref:class C sortase n=1 Tax=Chakrabartyella piscis TaxID=2918914 RepID=UPI002958B9B9|nr:class C sortase [Chakrabartyella piscis]
MKKRVSIFGCILIFVLGLGVMFYPTISNWVHEQTASYAISDYYEQISQKTEDETAVLFAAARAYNATLSGDRESFLEAEENEDNNIQNPGYWNTFDIMNDIIGVVDIPSIKVTLPIYHGTDETTLQKGVGHLEGSALPTGDIGNHTVLTGHTGLPSVELFTDLDQVVIGDVFHLQVLDQIFTYEVKEINVVLPSETESLQAQADKDLVTLVTCTPYGINSHRLLVTGEQIAAETQVASTNTTSHSNVIQKASALDSLPMLVAIAVGLLVLFIIAIVIRKRKKM